MLAEKEPPLKLSNRLSEWEAKINWGKIARACTPPQKIYDRWSDSIRTDVPKAILPLYARGWLSFVVGLLCLLAATSVWYFDIGGRI